MTQNSATSVAARSEGIPPSNRSPQRRRAGSVRVIILTIVAIPWVAVPIWLLLVNSVKPITEASSLEMSLPTKWQFMENYGKVISEGNYATALLNSLIIVIPTIIVVIALGSMAAWAFGRSRSMPMKIAFNLSVLSILLPPAILPTIYEMQFLGIDGTRPGYFLVMAGTRIGTVVFLGTGFIRGLPPDLEEAAAIDGASKIQIYRRIILPMLAPVLLVGSVILIITIWNEFFFAAFLLQGSERATLPLALFQFSSTSAEAASLAWNLIFAHVVLTSLPLVVVYLFVQRRIVSGLSEGAIKG